MTRNVTLHLDAFGQEALDRLVEHGSGSPNAALRTAAWYYLRVGESGRVGWRAPRFRSGPPRSPGIRVAFDDETWAALEDESGRQGVAAEELAVHALLFFLADFETGRVAELMQRALEDDPG